LSQNRVQLIITFSKKSLNNLCVKENVLKLRIYSLKESLTHDLMQTSVWFKWHHIRWQSNKLKTITL
jgi:hypothetical protein